MALATLLNRALGCPVIVAALGMASTAARPVPEPSPAPPSLAGRWVLNAQQSEDARAKMRDARDERPAGRFGRRGGGGGRGPGGPAGGFGGRGDALQGFLDPPEKLTITQSEAEIAIDDGTRVQRLHPDGRKTKLPDGTAEVTARWNGAELFVQSKPGRGREVTTAYMLVPDKHQLDVTSRVQGRSGDTLTVRRVYDAAAPQ
jgi:hypothetical protein